MFPRLKYLSVSGWSKPKMPPHRSKSGHQISSMEKPQDIMEKWVLLGNIEYLLNWDKIKKVEFWITMVAISIPHVPLIPKKWEWVQREILPLDWSIYLGSKIRRKLPYFVVDSAFALTFKSLHILQFHFHYLTTIFLFFV